MNTFVFDGYIAPVRFERLKDSYISQFVSKERLTSGDLPYFTVVNVLM